MLLNIEMKMPNNENMVPLYDYDLAAQLVVDLIEKYNIAFKVIVSSFDTRILDNVIQAATSDG